MAVWWPTPTSSCRVDLLVASYNQIYSAARCSLPGQGTTRWTDVAQETWQIAQQLKVADDIVNAVGPGVVKLISQASSYIKNELPDTLVAATNVVKALGLDAQKGLQADIAYAAAKNKSILDQVAGGIGGFINQSAAGLDNIVDTVTGNIGGLIEDAGAAVGNVASKVGSAVQGTINSAASAVASVVTTAKNSIAGLVADAGSFLGGILDNVGGALGDAVSFVGGTIADTIGNVRRFIDDLIRNVQTGIGGIVEKLTNIPAAVGALADDLIAAFGSGAAGFTEQIGKFLSDPLEGIIGGFFHMEEPEFLRLADQIYDVLTNNPETPASLRNTIVEAKVGGKPVPAIIAAVIIPVVLSGAISAVFTPLLQPAVQAEQGFIRATLFGLGDAVQAYNRGALSEAEMREQAVKAGYTDRLIDAAIALGKQLPSPVDLQDWRNRGFINDGQLVERVQRQGWTSEDAQNILAAADIVPNVSDLVRFAVREAFPGQVAYDGPRGTGTPARFIESAGFHGLTPEYARSYWAAHWELPSVTAVFDMYHRRLINESTLRAFLKEADFAPEWVDRIIAVAYDPLTRVDVRRMYDLGVLTKAQVEDAYRDLGYDSENARRLADFAEADNSAGKKTATDPQRDLTRADLVGAYADGVLNRSKAKASLVDIGYDDSEAELILDREDIRVMRAERKETKTAIVDQVVAGVIDIIAAQDKLNAGGYTDDEIKAALAEISRKQSALIRQPTKAELDRFRKAGMLTDDQYAVELSRLGYAPRWVEAFVALGAEQESTSG